MANSEGQQHALEIPASLIVHPDRSYSPSKQKRSVSVAFLVPSPTQRRLHLNDAVSARCELHPDHVSGSATEAGKPATEKGNTILSPMGLRTMLGHI